MAKAIGAKERYDAKRKGKRTRTWACVAYPDSVPSDWQKQLENMHIPMLISPLHDADTNADETEKKAHWHIMALWPSPVTETQAHAVFDCLNGSIPIMINSSEGYARYLIHADNPEKAQYNPEDVKALSGASWYALAYTQATADEKLLDEIERFIDTSGIVSFARLCIYAREFRPEWSATIHRRTNSISAYMRSMIWEFEGNPGKIPPREEWKQAEEKPKPDASGELILQGFTEIENEIRTKRGEFKD